MTANINVSQADTSSWSAITRRPDDCLHPAHLYGEINIYRTFGKNAYKISTGNTIIRKMKAYNILTKS